MRRVATCGRRHSTPPSRGRRPQRVRVASARSTIHGRTSSTCKRAEETMRLKDKVAVIIGAGQNPGATIGNGRATALRFAQEGARILAVDRRLDLAEETAELARAEGADCAAFQADVTQEATLAATMAEAVRRWGRIDVLHYNVGISIEGHDAPVTEITEAAFDRICQVNLRGAVMSCKHVLPIMRAQRSGVLLMISSISA